MKRKKDSKKEKGNPDKEANISSSKDERPGIFNREKKEYAQLKRILAISKQLAEENLKSDRVAEKIYVRLKKYYGNRGKVLLKLNSRELNTLIRNLNESDIEESKMLASIIEIQAK